MSDTSGPVKGRLTVLSGPSGVGKAVIGEAVLRGRPWLTWSVSCTTRRQGRGEVNHRDYHFLTVKHFEGLIAAGAFLEWARFGDNYYGTLKPDAEINLFVECELIGAMSIRRLRPDAQFIWVCPPGATATEQLVCLRDRQIARNRDPQTKIGKRLQIAYRELKEAPPHFDHIVVSDDLDTARAKVGYLVDVHHLAA